MARTSSVYPCLTCVSDSDLFVSVPPIVIHAHLAQPMLVATNIGSRYNWPLMRGRKNIQRAFCGNEPAHSRPALPHRPSGTGGRIYSPVTTSHLRPDSSSTTHVVHLVLQTTIPLDTTPWPLSYFGKYLVEATRPWSSVCPVNSPSISGTATIRNHRRLSQSWNLLLSSDLHTAVEPNRDRPYVDRDRFCFAKPKRGQ